MHVNVFQIGRLQGQAVLVTNGVHRALTTREMGLTWTTACPNSPLKNMYLVCNRGNFLGKPSVLYMSEEKNIYS